MKESYRDLTLEELRKEADRLRESIFRLRIRNQLGQLDNPIDIRKNRRNLARVLTILRDMEISRLPSQQETQE